MISRAAKMLNSIKSSNESTTMHHSVYFQKVQEVTKQLSEARQKEIETENMLSGSRFWQWNKEQKELIMEVKMQVVLLQRKLHKLKLMQRNGNYYEY